MKFFHCFILLVSILLAALASASDSNSVGWVVLSKTDISNKSNRIRYARFLKEQHYLNPYRIIPELSPKEAEWINSRWKDIDEALNDIKDKNTPMMKSEEGRAWLAMDAQFRSSTLYLQNKLKNSLGQVITALNIIINSKNVIGEMQGWSLLVDNLLDYLLNGDHLYKAVNALEKEKGLIFTRNNFLLQNSSIHIAREINKNIFYSFFEGKIKE